MTSKKRDESNSGAISSSEAMLTEEDTAVYLSVTVNQLRRWRCDGRGPRFAKFGQRTIAYKKRWLDEWTEKMSAQSTAELQDKRTGNSSRRRKREDAS